MPDEKKPEDKGLRIAHAGFIQFFAQLVTLATGLLFVTLVTRNLSVSDFGLWQILGSATGLAMLPSIVVTFWSLRGAARREDVGKSSIAAAVMTLPLAFGIFLAVSTGVGTRVDIVTVIVIAGLLQLPFMTLFEGLKPTVQATRPTVMGYASLPFELAKVAVAYYLVVGLKIGLQGAILSLVAAYAVQNLVIFYGVRDKVHGKIDFRKIVGWVKASWVPLLDRGVARIWSSDAIVVALVLGTAVPVGLFQGARVFTAIIMYSEIFLRVLYPKLIRDRLGSDVAVAFRLQTLLEIPMVVGAFVLAENLLSVLGPSYVGSATVLRLLAIGALVESTEHVTYFVLYGAETSDSKNEGLSFTNLRKSWLVKLPLLDLTKSVVYVSILAFSLYFLASPSSPETAVLVWGVAYLGIVTPYTILKAFLARKFFPHTLPVREILTYIFAGIVMGFFLLFLRPTSTVTNVSAISAILRLGYLVGLGALVYFGIVFALDKHFRTMVRQLYMKVM
ncbi:MAG: hypothetical protein HYU02_04890 [Thaumarchaeota archaeon]|nr:hypothetical protein [Nitrososphaerota archaeon]